MSHGTSKIIRRSYIEDDLIRIFLDHQQNYPKNCFEKANPTTEVEYAILEFLDREGFGCSKKYVEFWFQSQQTDQDLMPHVDFNEGLRIRMSQGEKFTPERLMSPITIACYLESEDLIGGELCVSSKSWMEYEVEPYPEELKKQLLECEYESYRPEKGDVIYFEGSRYYHWIERVQNGSRKSMLINFWDEFD